MKTSRTKYSKFNKEFGILLDNINNDTFQNIAESSVGDINNMALINSIDSFSKYGYENIFIETTELYNFLRDTKIITHGDISAQLYAALEKRNFKQLGKEMGIDEIIELRCYNFMVYGPIDKVNTALAVTLYVTEKEITYSEIKGAITKDNIIQNTLNWSNLLFDSLCWTGKSEFGSNYISLTEKTFSEKEKKNWTKKDVENFNVIINMLFYMNAFPNYVYDGVPKKAVLDNKVSVNHRITLTPNKEFFEKIKISPHLRRGHFRTFSSDYFTNMKGKTIWIEPVFIKGKAITVEEDGIFENDNENY